MTIGSYRCVQIMRSIEDIIHDNEWQCHESSLIINLLLVSEGIGYAIKNIDKDPW